jgi:hypothetical protein
MGRREAVLGGKVIAGVGKAGFGMGFEAHARVGRVESANLSASLRKLPEIGSRFDVRFGAQPYRNLMLGITVGATNEPNQGDLAAKLATEFEYIGFSNFSLLVRGSWQGRSLDHGGIGGGAGIGVTW